MCGIAGILRLDGGQLGQSAESGIRAMLDKMLHRGPDGGGIWREGPICLGHRRLSIIDLAGGSQPMPDAGGNCQIVFNGEIYNFRELKTELSKSGAVFNTDSDTETILAAYGAWGLDCLEHLEGMFAFALWDIPKKRLFCARDRFGEKPFYYTAQNGLFAFASELDALRELARLPEAGEFSFNLDDKALLRYLAYEYVPCPQTMWKNVHNLEPSHCLLVENEKLETRRYWDMPMPAEKAEAPEGELAEELRRLLDRAVSMRMISDVPLGVFLSGGIDSSIVACLMARHSQRPVETFSIGFREASYDESAYARIVARAIASEHHERVLSASECARELPGIVSRMDTPMADASCAPTWLLSGLARENVTVALGGDGADEFWAGYEHYIGCKIALSYNRLPKVLREKFVEKLADYLPASAGYINPRLAVRAFLRGAAAPDWLRTQTMLTAIEPEKQAEILNADWLAAHGLSHFINIENIFAPTRKQFEHWRPMEAASPLARAFHVYARQFMLDDILVKVDRCSMLHSLEARAPFLDRKVVEFAARLPVSCKLHGFKRKYLLKKAFSKLLPEKILKRNKRGFQIPVAQWLREELKPLLCDLLAPGRLKKQGIFNPAPIQAMLEAHFSARADLRKQLWTLLVLQIWLDANHAA